MSIRVKSPCISFTASFRAFRASSHSPSGVNESNRNKVCSNSSPSLVYSCLRDSCDGPSGPFKDISKAVKLGSRSRCIKSISACIVLTIAAWVMGTSFTGACGRAEGTGAALPINWIVAFGLILNAETR